MTHPLQWKKYHPLSDQNAFICLVDHMGDDSSIVQAARVSYDKDIQEAVEKYLKLPDGDRQLIRYLLRHTHTTPFEMVEIKFMVQVPMDCWRQWIRHRTASVNEYSTRYTEALDFCQVTQPDEWRLQSTNNKQGSSGYLEEWPERWKVEETTDYLHDTENSYGIFDGDNYIHHCPKDCTPGSFLTEREYKFHQEAKKLYNERLALGIAKEQARKDLPLSTYTRAYWKCDLHNIFNFLRLRMDSHAQLEIRSFANCMFEIVKQICPVACEAFEDYVLHAKKFSRMEMEILRTIFVEHKKLTEYSNAHAIFNDKPDTITDREWKEFLEKLQ